VARMAVVGAARMTAITIAARPKNGLVIVIG